MALQLRGSTKALLLLALPALSAASSLLLAKLCRGETCTDREYPILDYSEADKKCICAAHPCWNDNGIKHACTDKAFPYLSFSYLENGDLFCNCNAEPHYASTHISKDLCAGHRCEDPQHPILDWDEDSNSCLCRTHPCWQLEGMKHECNSSAYPLLRYREEVDDNGAVKPICDCISRMEQATRSSEL